MTAINEKYFPEIPNFGRDIPPLFVTDTPEDISHRLDEFFSIAAKAVKEFDAKVAAHIEEHGSDSIYAVDDYLPHIVVQIPVALEDRTAPLASGVAATALSLAIATAKEHGFEVVDTDDSKLFPLCVDEDGDLVGNDFGILAALAFPLDITWGEGTRKFQERVGSSFRRSLEEIRILSASE